MKKVKVMLTAMIILGTVGGVLAIKAKRLEKYCIADVPAGGNCTPTGGLKCTIGALQEIHASGVDKCYKTTLNTADCKDADENCTAKTKLRADSGN